MPASQSAAVIVQPSSLLQLGQTSSILAEATNILNLKSGNILSAGAPIMSMISGLMSIGGGGGGSGESSSNLMLSNTGITMAASDSGGGSSSLSANSSCVSVTSGNSSINAAANGQVTVSGNTLFQTLPQANVGGLAANLATQAFATSAATSAAASAAATAYSNATSFATSAVNGIDLSGKLNTSGGTISGSLAVGGAGSAGKLYVTGTSGSTAGAYGYLKDDGTTGTSTGTIAYGIYAVGRIGTNAEFNASSDRRLKEDIKPISAAEAIKFLKNVDGVKFRWKDNEDKREKLGFIAQDVIRAGYPNLINATADTSLKEEKDPDGLVSPDGAVLQLSYDSVIPLLAAALKDALARIDELESHLGISHK